MGTLGWCGGGVDRGQEKRRGGFSLRILEDDLLDFCECSICIFVGPVWVLRYIFFCFALVSRRLSLWE